MKHNYKELLIWQRSMSLASEIYKATSLFPKEEKYGLVDQLNRSAISVPSDIANGCSRNTDLQMIDFINIAIGSLSKIETQLIISSNLNFINEADGQNLITEVDELKKMATGFKNIIKQKL